MVLQGLAWLYNRKQSRGWKQDGKHSSGLQHLTCAAPSAPGLPGCLQGVHHPGAAQNSHFIPAFRKAQHAQHHSSLLALLSVSRLCVCEDLWGVPVTV